MDSRPIKSQAIIIEGIDLTKLVIVFRDNWIWILLIFLSVNLAAYIKLRYTPGLFQSECTIQLEVKNEASGLGINFVEESKNDILSSEIEIIQSRLFLNHVLDSLRLNTSFYSIGRLLQYNQYNNPPAFIKYDIKDASVYNHPFYYEQINDDELTLRIGDSGNEIHAKYGETISLPEVSLIIKRNPLFKKGDELGYYFTFSSKEALLNYLLENLTVEPLNFNAKTIRLAFKDNNPFKAQDILNEISSQYLQYSNDQKNLTIKQKIDWVTNELKQIEKKMEGYEDYFEEFTLQNKTGNLEEDLRSTVITISRIDSQRFNITRRINEINRLNNDLNSGNLLTLSPRHLLPDYLNKSLETMQNALLQQEKLKLSYNETTYAFISRQKEIDNLQLKIFSQIVELKKELLLKISDLNLKKDKLEKDFASMPDKNTQFSKNQRFYKLYEGFYLTLMQSKAEFEIAQAGSTSDYKILSPATLPAYPISPKKLMIAGIGAVFSFILILFFIGILYLLNNRITNLNDLDKVGEVPVLGIIPTSRHSESKELYVLEHPKSMVSEAIRTLRTNLDFFSYGTTNKVIAISSTVSGEGKSFIAMNLGCVLAQSLKRVVLLDLDMRKPKKNLPTASDDNSKGISTILIRKNTWQECLIKTATDNFDYLPSGPHPPNPSELLMNGEFSNLIDDLKNNYDFIILDTPPVGLVTDGIMAMKLADISIYVFRANYSRKDFIFNLKRIISINKFSNITLILNSISSTDKKGYGYGYYEEAPKPNSIKSLFKKYSA